MTAAPRRQSPIARHRPGTLRQLLAVALLLGLFAMFISPGPAIAQEASVGDVDCDGMISLADAQQLGQYVGGERAGITDCSAPDTAINTTRADLNNDGSIDATDVQLLLLCQAGLGNPGTCEGDINAIVPVGREQREFFDRAADFTANLDTPRNVHGALTGHVAFVQATLITPSGNTDRPNLVPGRDTYLLFFADAEASSVTAVIGGTRYTLLPAENEARHDGPGGGEPIAYSKRAWNGVVAGADMQPGMSITFETDTGLSGAVSAGAFVFGAPIDQTLIATRIAMLTELSEVPVDQWMIEGQSAQLALDYYNTVQISHLRVASYEPMVLDRIVMPDGTVYIDKSAFVGATVHKGDMRERIAKGLIGSGITLANVGITSTSGGSQQEPRPFRQTSAHMSAGAYTDEAGERVVVRHGLSGGGGQLTLLSGIGNEFSHEIGHDYGLGHYPGGDLSTHSRNGAWGYDSFRDRLLSNLRWVAADAEFPWEFNRDAMAGGSPRGSVSQYTLHTPHSLKLIQDNVTAGSGWYDPQSTTGYAGWDVASQSTFELAASPATPLPQTFGGPVTTLVGFYDPEGTLESTIYPAMHGNWGVIFDPAAMAVASGIESSQCQLEVTGAGATTTFLLHDTRLSSAIMNQFHINVPASFAASSARVVCNGTEQAARTLDSPQTDLAPPIELGGSSGIADTALRLPDASVMLGSELSTSLTDFERRISVAYGAITRFETGLVPVPGRLYELNGSYFQATTAASGPPPGSGWRPIATASDYLSDAAIELGAASSTYQVADSGVLFTVAPDGVGASASTFGTRGAWYDSRTVGTVTTLARANDGSIHELRVRAQKNDAFIPSRGEAVNVPAYFRATVDPADNPDLSPGVYEVDFSVRVLRWHNPREQIDTFRVTGSVTID